jgi:hypothetical protein
MMAALRDGMLATLVYERSAIFLLRGNRDFFTALKVLLVLAVASGCAEVCSKDSGLTCTNCTHVEVRRSSETVVFSLH